MRDGCVVESGSPRDLLAKQGYYWSLVRRQVCTLDDLSDFNLGLDQKPEGPSNEPSAAAKDMCVGLAAVAAGAATADGETAAGRPGETAAAGGETAAAGGETAAGDETAATGDETAAAGGEGGEGGEGGKMSPRDGGSGCAESAVMPAEAEGGDVEADHSAEAKLGNLGGATVSGGFGFNPLQNSPLKPFSHIVVHMARRALGSGLPQRPPLPRRRASQYLSLSLFLSLSLSLYIYIYVACTLCSHMCLYTYIYIYTYIYTYT